MTAAIASYFDCIACIIGATSQTVGLLDIDVELEALTKGSFLGNDAVMGIDAQATQANRCG